MGKRLTQIATRTGDDGTTGLGDGFVKTVFDRETGEVEDTLTAANLSACFGLPLDLERRCLQPMDVADGSLEVCAGPAAPVTTSA